MILLSRIILYSSRQRVTCSSHRKMKRCIRSVIKQSLTHLICLVPHVEQELLTNQENLSSPLVFSEVRVARSLVFCVVFCRSLPLFYCDPCIVCSAGFPYRLDRLKSRASKFRGPPAKVYNVFNTVIGLSH